MLRARTKPKPLEKPANRKIVGLEPRTDIDDEAGDRRRAGIQSLGRAFAILEDVARHRDGIGLADLSKRVVPAGGERVAERTTPLRAMPPAPATSAWRRFFPRPHA